MEYVWEIYPQFELVRIAKTLGQAGNLGSISIAIAVSVFCEQEIMMYK